VLDKYIHFILVDQCSEFRETGNTSMLAHQLGCHPGMSEVTSSWQKRLWTPRYAGNYALLCRGRKFSQGWL